MIDQIIKHQLTIIIEALLEAVKFGRARGIHNGILRDGVAVFLSDGSYYECYPDVALSGNNNEADGSDIAMIQEQGGC